MINGLYNSASGMDAELMRQDVVANNLANASSTGFKKDKAVFTAFPNVLVHRIHDKLDENRQAFYVQPASPLMGVVGRGVQTHAVVTDFGGGSLQRSDRPLDLALKGAALFSVERADGTAAYTRAGNFTANGSGQLVTQAGDVVLDQGNRPISVRGSEVVVDAAGRVTVDGEETGRLKLEPWVPGRFVKMGESLFIKPERDLVEAVQGAPLAADVTVVQGFLEESNVRVVEEMVDMITVMRAYEANQKAIQMQDETLDKAINQVGRV